MTSLLGMNGLQVCGLLAGIACGVSALVTYCACVVSGRASDAEREILEDELAGALARNRYPAKTRVQTICRGCQQPIGRHYIDYDPSLGAVHIVDGMHLRCRRGGEIEINFDELPTAADVRRKLRSLEGVHEAETA